MLCNIKNVDAGLKPVGYMVDPAKFNVDTDTLVQFLRTQPTFLAHKETQDNSPGTPGLLITSLSVRLFMNSLIFQ